MRSYIFAPVFMLKYQCGEGVGANLHLHIIFF